MSGPAPGHLPRIGYYVHHHGHGHRHRAAALAVALGPEVDVVGLGSLPRPEGWAGGWVRLPLDVGGLPDDGPGSDPTAGGRLHWAPLHEPGLRERTAAISAWIERDRPCLVVCDVSQEVALLVRLHGVPVLAVVQPGHRPDPAHHTGLGAATALCGFWPAGAAMTSGLPDDVTARVRPLGALSRFAPRNQDARAARAARDSIHERRLVVLGGGGGDAWDAADVAALRVALAGRWSVEVLGPGGLWVDDPERALRTADVVVVQAGQNAVAEVAAARVPAVVVPAARPFAEQERTAAVLDAGPWPAVALPRLAHPDWPGLLDRVAALDGDAWAPWCDGGAASRFADVVRGLLPGPVQEGAA